MGFRSGAGYSQLGAANTFTTTQTFQPAAAASRAIEVIGFGTTAGTRGGTQSAVLQRWTGKENVPSIDEFGRVALGDASDVGLIGSRSGSTSNLFRSPTASATIIGIDAHASQTGFLFAVRPSGGASIYSGFNKTGYFATRKIAAPADADLSASELALWFDATDGAGKLMVKAKTANGTVATAAVALS